MNESSSITTSCDKIIQFLKMLYDTTFSATGCENWTALCLKNGHFAIILIARLELPFSVGGPKFGQKRIFLGLMVHKVCMRAHFIISSHSKEFNFVSLWDTNYNLHGIPWRRNFVSSQAIRLYVSNEQTAIRPLQRNM